jgi:hypothetical protein
MFVKIVASLFIVIIVFLTYVSFLPSTMKISRELVIKASPEILFAYINNSKKMNEWMPWQDSDPNVKMQYSGPEQGIGSTSSWESTGKMGTGNAIIVESIPNQSVKTQLSYTQPMAMSQLAELTLTPDAAGTKVTWSVSSQNGFFSKAVGVFVNLEKMVGDEFDKGLAKLKSIAEM